MAGEDQLLPATPTKYGSIAKLASKTDTNLSVLLEHLILWAFRRSD